MTGRWFSPGTLASPNIKTDRYDIAEILLKEKFDDTKGVIIIRKAKDRQRNGQKKKGQTDKQRSMKREPNN